MTWSDLHFSRMSVATVPRLHKSGKTGAVIQSAGGNSLGQGPAVQVVRNGQVLETF